VTAEDRHSGDKLGTDSDAGVMLRPETSVLANEALAPERNLVRPAPNRVTHELLVDEPYRFDRPERAGEPDGVLPSGTRVVLHVGGPDRCRVSDGSDLYVEVRRASLRKVPHA
jgi:hypothetical protein